MKKGKLQRKRIIISLAVLLILAIIVAEGISEFRSNKRYAFQTESVIMDQVKSVLKKSRAEEELLLSSLRDDYMTRAQAVAYVLMDNDTTKMRPYEFSKLADYLSVDEINLFDANGVIYAGTNSNYFGMDFDSGEQISYFKPMLLNKQLVMCQDFTPNTADSKVMMYAMCWDETETFMVQVGIEPIRLEQQKKNNDLATLISSISTIDGFEIYVAEAGSEEIVGTGNDRVMGKSLTEIGIDLSGKNLSTINYFVARVQGKSSICSVTSEEGYIVCVVQKFTDANRGLGLSLLLLVIALLIVSGVAVPLLIRMNRQVQNSYKDMEQQMAIIEAVSDEYTDINIIDTKKNKSAMLKTGGKMKEYSSIQDGMWRDYMLTWESYANKYIIEEDRARVLKEVSCESIEKAFAEGDEYSSSFRLVYQGEMFHFQVKFKKMNQLSSGEVFYISAFRSLDAIIENQKRMEQLQDEANRDTLTGFYNRRAFEAEISRISGSAMEEDFVVVALDINGLKYTNDTLGHDAGDELILGAAECMRRCIEPYGSVYRTGGDEFVALIYANETYLKHIRQDFAECLLCWRGERVRSVSVSFGSAAHYELADMTIQGLVKIADKRMYKEKAAYYEGTDHDRRKRSDYLAAEGETDGIPCIAK